MTGKELLGYLALGYCMGIMLSVGFILFLRLKDM